MSRVLLTCAMISFAVGWHAVAGPLSGQRVEPVPTPDGTAVSRPAADATRCAEKGKPEPNPAKSFDQEPVMVIVQALLFSVSLGDADKGDRSGANGGSLANALVEKLNQDLEHQRVPMSTWINAFEGLPGMGTEAVRIEALAAVEVSALANQRASVQLGHRKSRITGVTVSSGDRLNQTTQENVGTLLELTPRVTPGGPLILDVNLETSRLAPEEEGTIIAELDDGGELRSPQVGTFVVKTTVAAANGRAVVVSDFIHDSQSTRKETVVILRPLVEKVEVSSD